MESTITNLDEFSIVGISIRTSNENGQSAGDIGNLWQRFFTDNISGRVPNKVSDDIYCVYTDYDSDADGPYTTILGHKVSSINDENNDLIGKKISAAKYNVYKSSGKMPEVVLATWTHIWQNPPQRSYQADFDVYGKDSGNPGNAEVTTYVSVA